MGKSLSVDIRERLVTPTDDGLSRHEAVRRLRMSKACAVRIMQRKRRTGGVKTTPLGRPRRSNSDAVSDWFKSHVVAESDITIPELSEVLQQEHDLTPSAAPLLRHLIHRLGVTYDNNG